MGKNKLEKRADKVNLEYRKSGEALILKVPIPKIFTKQGLIVKPSTVDYTGLIQGGRFIAFDAKRTKVTTRFDLSNVHQHQIDYLDMVKDLGGIGFFLIHFYELYDDKAYITPLDIVQEYFYERDRKSIPIDEFKDDWLVNINNYLDPWLNT